ncbi:MAG: prefoldin subunit beta [Candidatus Aenigmatarchaeota archaeon]
MSEETKNMITQFQAYQQQLQTILLQKESLNMQIFEIERALEELNKTKENEAYKIAGQVMIKKPVEELKKELSEAKESIEIRIKSLEKSEAKTNEKLKELETKIREKI